MRLTPNPAKSPSYGRGEAELEEGVKRQMLLFLSGDFTCEQFLRLGLEVEENI